MDTSKLLQVYTASAGAGKTYTLSEEYIALALRNPEQSYQHILAVTFTKKATEEMKSRIIEALYDITQQKSPMCSSLCERLQLSPEALVQKAKTALKVLLSDYSAFKIKTIDSFFEEIVRSFATEIGHQSNYRIELDNDYWLHKGTLLLFNSLENEEKKDARSWIDSIVKSGIDEGDRYNVLPQIENIGKQIFAAAELQGTVAYALPTNEEIESLRKEIDSSITALSIEKKSSSAKVTSEEMLRYNSLQCIAKELPLLATLGHIDASMKEEGKEQNTMLLFSSQAFINTLINSGDSDSSFLYERTGVAIHNFMIDEFQDTSRLQYNNLKPLLANSLSAGNKNLIVGDVKQSIYKFRHCDRTILQEAVPADFEYYYNQTTLKQNWRSAPEIVNFNNILFKQLPGTVSKMLADTIQNSLAKVVSDDCCPLDQYKINQLTQSINETYKHSEQKASFPDNHGGVEYYLLDTGHSPITSEEENGVPPLCEKIIDLIVHKKYKPRDIAVLVNTNKQAGEVAATFLQFVEKNPRCKELFKFTSAEALKLSSSKIVGLIIDLLSALSDNKDRTSYDVAHLRYRNLIDKDINKASFKTYFDSLKEEAAHSTLSHLTNQIIKQIASKIPESEITYVMALQDTIDDFHQDRKGSLAEFVDWWHTRGYKQDLPTRDENAINIMTIHKAKGLGFPIVLLPFLTWDLGFTNLSSRSAYLWVSPSHVLSSGTEYPSLKVPIKRTKELEKTLFLKEYYEEMVKEVIDRLNLFYVAATRAKKGMVLWVKTPTDREQKKLLLHTVLSEVLWGKEGNKLLPTQEIPSQEDRAEETKNTESLSVPSIHHYLEGNLPRLRIHLQAQERFEEENLIERGSALHEILSNVSVAESLPFAISKAIAEGYLREDQCQSTTLLLEKMLQHPYGKRWFARENVILNEQTILIPEGTRMVRPDRVVKFADGSVAVIDYKFAHPKESHKQQVAGYSICIKQMGFDKVEGFLWYSHPNGSYIEKVYPYKEATIIK